MAHQSGSGGRAASSSIGIPGSGLATVETRAPQREERQPRSAQGAAVRSNAIDILRAVAVLLVLGRHLAPCPESVSPTLHALTSVWHRGGWVGVDLFFVLRSAYATYWLVYFPLYLCGALILGIVMAAVVEYPALRLRDRMFPARGQPMIGLPARAR